MEEAVVGTGGQKRRRVAIACKSCRTKKTRVRKRRGLLPCSLQPGTGRSLPSPSSVLTIALRTCLFYLAV